MRHLRQLSGIVAFLLVWLVGRAALADNVCGETVPSNHIIDGIPSYAQCTASSSSAIYSNNGVDTATASSGTGWVRTQYSGGYQCTELAHRYLYFKWNVQSVPNGNAGTWCDGTIPSGLVKNTTPVHGDLIVFAPGSCGADATTGHVAVVDVVNSDSTVTFVQQNNAARRSCAISTAACFLHATANDGTSVDGGALDAAAPDAGPATDDASPPGDLAADRRRADASTTSSTGGAGGTSGVIGTGGASGTGGAVVVTSSGGEAGSGGVMGAGGALATGGQVGAGGTTGSGGSSGTGGTSSSGGTTGTATTEPATSSSSGCGCHLADRGSPGRGCLPCLVALALAAIVRRRRRP